MGSPSLPIEKIYRDVVEHLKEFHSVQEELRNQLTVHHPTHWLPPLPSVYKVNFDGATFPDIAAARLGVVVRDSEGLVIAVLLEQIHLPPTVAALEVLACRRSIVFAVKLGLQDVAFEGDSEVSFKLLTAEQPCMTAFGHIIEDSRSLATTLRSATFTHTKHQGNNVADKLTKLAKNLYEPQVWLEDIHSNVTDLVTVDRSFLHF